MLSAFIVRRYKHSLDADCYCYPRPRTTGLVWLLAVAKYRDATNSSLTVDA